MRSLRLRRPLRSARGISRAARRRLSLKSGLKQRVVVTEFPSVEQAVAAYESPAYQEALRALGDGAVRDVRIVEAVE